VGNLEQVFILRIQSLELDCKFLKTMILPQHDQCISMNQVSTASRHGNPEEGQGGFGVALMEVEEESRRKPTLQSGV
jgi:hypothetical protein